MSNARKLLYERISAYSYALNSQSIVSRSLTEVNHNSSARILRNGLAVASFAIFEDFIKVRTSEILEKIGSGLTKFSELPESLQKACTIVAIDAIKYQAKIQKMKQQDLITSMQSNAILVASTAQSSYSLPTKIFGYSQSNIGEETITDIFQSLNCGEPWNIMSGIASRSNCGILDLRPSFRNSVNRRHSAAHNASASIEYSELQSFHAEMIALTMTFDIALSLALRKILDRNDDFVLNGKKMESKMVKIRFIERKNLEFREYLDLSKRAINLRGSVEDIRLVVFPKAKSNSEAVIFLNERRMPYEWATPYLD